MRDADVIVCTSIGASDSRLLAACGIKVDEDEAVSEFLNGKTKSTARTSNVDETMIAPDGLPPLSMPFVIVDEACQSIEPGSLIPVFSTNSCRSLVMLGDPCQLPPTVISDSSGSGLSPLSISLMSRLASTLPQPVIVTSRSDKTPRDELYLNLKMTKQAASLVRNRDKSSQYDVSYRKRYSGSLLLSVQYRMHPSIAAFSSAVFYDGLLSTPKFLSVRRPVPSELDDILPLEKGQVSVRFVNIEGPENENKGDPNFSEGAVLSSLDTSLPQSSSYTNEAEAFQLIDMLKEFMKNRLKSRAPFDGNIGVVTPYSGQAVLLKTMMSSDSELSVLLQKGPISIEVNTIDSYQGRERDIIFFSTVRSNKKGNVGFLSDWRRMNVALTRAKMGLVVFGDMNTLVNDYHWEAFCKWCENVECVFDVEPSDTNTQTFQ
jgi:superfamily I DNA and/or RNA helicase